MTLLTALEPNARHTLGDAVRSIAWSPTGRAIALGADGRALLTSTGRMTAPIGPDPIVCCWLAAERIAVVDGSLGVVVAGGGSVDIVPIGHALDIRSPVVASGGTGSARPGCGVVVGRDGVAVVRPDPAHVTRPITIDTGPMRSVAHLGGSIWLAGGADGLVVVDVALGCIDQRIELPGVVALAAAPHAGRVAAADSTGALHVLELAHLEHGVEVTGYPDAVRLLDITRGGELVVACADDELSWWSVSANGEVTDQPECTVGHDHPITACAVGSSDFVATGDADGMVRLWSPRLRDLPVASIEIDGEITALAWNHSGDQLAVGAISGDVVVADVSAGELL